MTDVRGRRGTNARDTHAQGDSRVKRQRETGYLQAEEAAGPGSWTSSFQKCEKINFCRLSHSVRGLFLQQPRLTNTLF